MASLGKEPWKILRGVWFEVTGEKWYPIEETEGARIEHEHRQRPWREKVGERAGGRKGSLLCGLSYRLCVLRLSETVSYKSGPWPGPVG